MSNQSFYFYPAYISATLLFLLAFMRGKKKMKENIRTFKTSTCESKESSTRCVSKEKETRGIEMTNIILDFSLSIFYNEVCDFSGSKTAVFICNKGEGFLLILSSVPKIPFSDIFGQDEIFSFIFPFSKCFQ